MKSYHNHRQNAALPQVAFVAAFVALAYRPGSVPQTQPSCHKAEPQQQQSALQNLAAQVATSHNIDPALFMALVSQESAWNPDAVSHAGATGLTQLMPATAEQHCGLAKSDLTDVTKNLDCGASYLATQLARFNGDTRLALAAYNAGPERVARAGDVPAIAETQDYVQRICAASGTCGGVL